MSRYLWYKKVQLVRIASLVLALQVLQGCHVLDPYIDTRVPHSNRTNTIPSPSATRDDPISIYDTTDETSSSAPSEGVIEKEPEAVISLLSLAENQQQNQDWVAAAATIERALRISPDSPTAYLQLAQVRIKQRLFPEAEQLARKGLLYADRSNQVRDIALYNALWEVIAQAKLGVGDSLGAEKARSRLR